MLIEVFLTQKDIWINFLFILKYKTILTKGEIEFQFHPLKH